MALFVKVKRSMDLGKARAHVNYIAFRSRETPAEQRGAFDAHRDRADARLFAESLDDRLTRHPMATKAYKVTISLSEREFRQLGLTSWKPVVREAMANLQQRWGKEFDWIASEHMARGHPHVHIVIKATCRDGTGRLRQLRLDRQHLAELRQDVGRIIERDRPRAVDRSSARFNGDTLLRGFERVLMALAAREREDEHENERAHQRWLRSRSRDDDRGR
ncbi:MAG: relaxase/mobilization nuclease domain-containing protein [Bacillota bacterium]